MIPKIIHYCWFGRGPMTALEKKCLASWKKHCPDFEIKLWNEDNFDVNYCEFTKEAYRLGKFAFVSDVARLYALQQEGGVYLDTDMLLIKPIPNWLMDQSLFLGKENSTFVSAGVLGVFENHPFINDLLYYYQSLNYSFNPPLIPEIISSRIDKLNIDDEMSFIILESDYFYPLPYKLKHLSYKKFLTEDTIGVHLWKSSWKGNKKSKLFKEVKYWISKYYLPRSIEFYKSKFR